MRLFVKNSQLGTVQAKQRQSRTKLGIPGNPDNSTMRHNNDHEEI